MKMEYKEFDVIKDKNNNIYKKGDKVKCISNKDDLLEKDHLYTIEMIFSINNELFSNLNNGKYIIIYVPFGRFIKVGCLKNKVRKLKRLLKI